MLRNVLAAPSSDEITSLPGWNQVLPSKQYSGYLNITRNRHYHYWFVECEEDPENAPVVLWLNGGPGCSSLIGLIYEHGPFRINDSTNPPTLYRFDYNWAKLANMIYLESPVGVGFSYSDSIDDYDSLDDDSTVNDNFLAVEKFFELFPEYRKNDFYLTGESYAGVYVPMLAQKILGGTQNETYKGALLKGIAVGNGCTGTEIGVCKRNTTFIAQFFVQNTAFLEQEMKNKLEQKCNWDKPYDISQECYDAINEMNTILDLINPYGVYSDILTFNASSKASKAYFNQQQVMDAIHVKKPDIEWDICTFDNWGRNSSYHKTEPNLPRDTYPILNEQIQVLVYNGDWDAVVPYTDNERWTKDMGYDVTEGWHPWFYNGSDDIGKQVGGYATRYNTKFNFTFITVRGGRHEVPETAPVSSFEMLRRFLKGLAF